MNNEFRPLMGYEQLYLINESGVIKRIPGCYSTSKGLIRTAKDHKMTSRIDQRSRYLVINLTKSDGSRGTQYVHRLVALTFIPNPLNKPFVNHLNGNKLDPTRSNLEWVTQSENQSHAVAMKLSRVPNENYTPIRNMCTGELFPSIKAAALSINMDYDKCKQLFNRRRLNRTCLRLAA